MEFAALVAEFDEQMRRHPAAEPGTHVEHSKHVTRVVAEGNGWSGVLWSDLSHGDAEETIAAEVERFSDRVQPWEWKYYSYDRPPDLPSKLRAAGFAPGAVEAVLVAEPAGLAIDSVMPTGIELVPVRDELDVEALVRVHDEVFGGSHFAIGEAVLAGIASQPQSVAAVVAMAEGRPISAGRVEFPKGRDFATIWGGGTLPGWRGRGVFRSLVAYRAVLARQRGYRYLQVDASPESLPILLRLGFVEIAKTVPFLYEV